MSEDEPRQAMWPWRMGQSVGRTLYACPPDSSYRDGEVLIGMVDSPELAEHVVEIHNQWLEARQLSERLWSGEAPDAPL